jgi:hypothetical protein
MSIRVRLLGVFVVASAGSAVERMRPLCVYPQVARWKGAGSTDEAANFASVNPPR